MIRHNTAILTAIPRIPRVQLAGNMVCYHEPVFVLQYSEILTSAPKLFPSSRNIEIASEQDKLEIVAISLREQL